MVSGGYYFFIASKSGADSRVMGIARLRRTAPHLGAVFLSAPWIHASLSCKAAPTDLASLKQCPSIGYRLGLIFFELLESCHHVCSGYRLRLSSVLHSSFYKLFYESLRVVHSVVGA